MQGSSSKFQRVLPAPGAEYEKSQILTSLWVLHVTEASTIDWDERDIQETGTQHGHRGLLRLIVEYMALSNS